jgi:Ca-activated chloride channel family protein
VGNGDEHTAARGGEGSAGHRGDGQGGTSLFGIRDAGERIVYVIDRSSSMQDFGKLTAARRELESSLSHLDGSIAFQVLVYNQQVQPLNARGTQGLIHATVTNKNQILGQLKVVLPDGGTQHRAALQAALPLRPTVVYFLTDAEDPGLTAKEISAIVEQLAGATRIHCIQFGETPGQAPTAGNWLQHLAQATGGKYVHVRTDALRIADGESPTVR